MKIKLNILIITIISLSFFSCASTKVATEKKAYFMIYDHNNAPINDASIYINDKLIGKTDIYGRYVITGFQEDKIELKIQKHSYDTVSDSITLHDSLIFYYKMGTHDQYIRLADAEIENKNYSAAINYLTKAITINDSDQAWYLKGICYYYLQDKDKLIQVINRLSGNDKYHPYLVPFSSSLN